jgi:hypothetical protein
MVKAGPGEKVVSLKLKLELYNRLIAKAHDAGFQTVSELLRHLIRQYTFDPKEVFER